MLPTITSRPTRLYRGNLAFSWDVLKELNLLVGVQAFYEDAWLDQPDRCAVSFQCAFVSGKNKVTYGDEAGFAQLMYSHPTLGSLSAGARIENHSAAGSSFVPRGAYTLVAGPFHAKLIANEAFRAPGVENLNAVPTDASGNPLKTKPERTVTFEAELGYQLTDYAWLKANFFDITILDPISYFIDANGSEGYKNFPKTGTRGVEVEARIKHKRVWANLSYSYYQSGSVLAENQVPQYAVPVSDSADTTASLTDSTNFRQNVLLGWPQHKIAAYGAVEAYKDLWLSASVFWMSARYAYLSGILDSTGALSGEHIGSESPVAVASVFLTWKNVIHKGGSIQVGIHNLFDANYRYVEGYAGDHAPVPAPSREYFVRLAFDETGLEGANPQP